MLRPFLRAAVVCLLAPAAAPGQPPTLSGVGQLSGYTGSSMGGVAAGGVAAVGQATATGASRAARWTAAGGLQDLGTVAGLPFGAALGVSADGNTAFGYASSSDSTTLRPFRWTAAGGLTALALPAGQQGAYGGYSSADGTTAAFTGVSFPVYTAYRWTVAGGYQALPKPGGAFTTVALGLSADGGAVIGIYTPTDGGSEKAFRWTAAGGSQPLAGQPTGFNVRTEPYGVSADGRAVAGGSSPLPGQPQVPFRWTESGGYQSLGLLPGATGGAAYGLAADGGVAVGSMTAGGARTAFVYDAAGLRDLNAVAAAQGVNTSGWTFQSADAITGDALTGYVVVGTGLHNGLQEGFVLSGLQFTPVPEPATVLVVAAGGLVVARRLRRR